MNDDPPFNDDQLMQEIYLELKRIARTYRESEAPAEPFLGTAGASPSR